MVTSGGKKMMKKQLGRQTSLVNLELCQKSTTHPDRHHPVAIMDLIQGHLQQGYFAYFTKTEFQPSIMQGKIVQHWRYIYFRFSGQQIHKM